MAIDLTVHLDETTLDALDDLARHTNRPRNQLATEAIEDYVAFNARQIEKIKEGIAAADCGDFATEEEMNRLWAKYDVKR